MEKLSLGKMNKFLFFKLPSAYISGVRVKSIGKKEAVATVKHRWINQNPFRSMYWATQGMASELSTGILVMQEIAACGKNVSMLVRHQNGTFTKKAVGRINFICKDGDLIKEAIVRAIETGEGQTVTLMSEGIDEQGESVSKFEYQWGLKLKK